MGGGSTVAGDAAGALLRDDWPLIGRDDELREIRAERTTKRRRGVVIAGSAGVGKSRVARFALAEAAADGAATTSVAATDAARAIPLGPFAHLVPTAAATLEPLERLPLVMSELRRTAGGRPLVLSVDDADRLDTASAALVHQLAVTGTAFVIVTMCSGEPVSDAIASLWKDQLASRIDLLPLTREALADICSSVLGGEIEQGTLHRLSEVTRGNPLFLHELLLDGVEGGLLTGQEGIWRWRGPFGAATRVRELMERRLAPLDAGARHALEVLALGEPLPVDLLEVLVGADAVLRLERLELLRVEQAGGRPEVRISQPLYGEVLRASVPPLRARSIQRELADAVEPSDLKRPDDDLRVARWRFESGGSTDAAALLQAALHAEAAFDFVLTARLASAAYDAGAGDAAQRLLASALRGQGRAIDAERVWADLQSRSSSEANLVDIAFGRSMNLLFGLGSGVDACRVLDDAEQGVTTAESREALGTQRALIALYAGRPLEALAIAQPILEVPDQTPVNIVYATISAAPALAIAGRTAEAHALVDVALPLAFQLLPGDEVVDGTQLAGVLLAVKFLVHQIAGEVTEAHAVARATHAMAIEVGSHDGAAGLGCALGIAHLAAGRPRRAAQQLRESAVLLRDLDRNRYLPWCLAALAHALVLVGDIEGAAEAARGAEECRTSGLRLFDLEIERARAWLAAARGQTDEAHRTLLAATEEAEEAGQLGFALLALHDIVRLGRCDQGLADRLRAAAACTDSGFASRAVAHADALLLGDAVALEEVAVRFEEAGAQLYAAEVLASVAACHRAASRSDRAMVTAERARAMLRRCEGALPPGFSLLTADAPALTPREHEIAVLAADGLASKLIAERLFLSVRTVDNHLHRAYDKLGVRSRRELAVLLSGG